MHGVRRARKSSLAEVHVGLHETDGWLQREGALGPGSRCGLSCPFPCSGQSPGMPRLGIAVGDQMGAARCPWGREGKGGEGAGTGVLGGARVRGWVRTVDGESLERPA